MFTTWTDGVGTNVIEGVWGEVGVNAPTAVQEDNIVKPALSFCISDGPKQDAVRGSIKVAGKKIVCDIFESVWVETEAPE